MMMFRHGQIISPKPEWGAGLYRIPTVDNNRQLFIYVCRTIYLLPKTSIY
jgi:hypothetical protein